MEYCWWMVRPPVDLRLSLTRRQGQPYSLKQALNRTPQLRNCAYFPPLFSGYKFSELLTSSSRCRAFRLRPVSRFASQLVESVYKLAESHALGEYGQHQNAKSLP